MRSVSWKFACLGLAIAFAPAAATAQICTGTPAPEGGAGIEGTFTAAEGAKGFGGSVTGNLAGPISLQGGYSIMTVDNVDENVQGFHGGVGFELSDMSFSACPLVGAAYYTWGDVFSGIRIDLTQLVVPVGLGLGKTFSTSPSVDFSLYAIPQFLYYRTKATASSGGLSESETESTNEFGAKLGFLIGGSSVFGGAGVGFSTLEDSDPTFSVAAGILIGGSR